MEANLCDKAILITGATSGIGQNAAYEFAKESATLVLVGRNRKKLEFMKSQLGDKVHIFEYDLRDLEHIENIFSFAKSQNIKFDFMVHCAGIAKNSIIRANDIEDMDEVMKVNCFSFVELGKFFCLKKYSNPGGAVVALSSIASLLNDKGMVQYSASKAALNSVIKTMSKEFLKKQIRVNAILPAYVNTAMFTAGESQIDNFEEELMINQPLGIIPTENIVGIIKFLLSDYGKYITGELLVVSAGMQF